MNSTVSTVPFLRLAMVTHKKINLAAFFLFVNLFLIYFCNSNTSTITFSTPTSCEFFEGSPSADSGARSSPAASAAAALKAFRLQSTILMFRLIYIIMVVLYNLKLFIDIIKR